MKKIFFSWQSDIKSVRNKLKSALELSVKQLGNELEEAERPEIDSDTQGTFGSEDIITTIFEKIDDSALFVADVTPIASTASKLIPNPNVMAELGYAIKSKEPNTRLYIYCTHGLLPVEKMPFDIRGKSLIGFRTSDKPSEIATILTPMLKGMLANVGDSLGSLEHPYIYVCGAEFSSWSDGSTVALEIKNTEPDEYCLEKIEIEECVTEPSRSLAAHAVTKGISITGVTKIFSKSQPLIKMTFSRAGRIFHVKQEIKTILGADEQNHFDRFIERPIVVSSFDQ